MPAKVAVITRTKDRPLLLPRCIESVLGQTCRDWVHVIVNDGGDSVTLEGVVSRYAGQYDGRLKIIHNPVSVGMQNASNVAIQASESEFIAIHDDDDTWNEIFLEETVRYLDIAGPQSREQGVAVQSYWIMEEIDSWGKVIEVSRRDFFPFESVSLFQLAAKNLFPPIAFLYRRTVHERIGGFNQTFNELGDHDFNLRFLAQYDIGVIQKKLAAYHWRRQANGSSYGNSVTDGVASHRKTLVKMQNQYLREDLADRRIGLGFLMNIARSLEVQKEEILSLARRTDETKGILHEVARRLLYYQNKIDGLLRPWKVKWPRPVYDHFADWISAPAKNGHGHEAGNGHASKVTLENGIASGRAELSELSDAKLLLVRQRTDVFLYMQGEVRGLLKLPALGFVSARVAAEEELRATNRQGEPALDEIYDVLQKRLHCDEKTAEQIRELEAQTECRLGYANPKISPTRKNGADGTTRMPEHGGKPSGRRLPLVDQHTSLSGAWEGDLASSLYTGLARRRRFEHPLEDLPGEAFWEMLGYEVVGPLHHAFISWVIARASKLGLKKLFFLSRDGFPLVKEFELFREKLGLQMQGEYIFASRRLWNVARIDRLDEESMVLLAAPNPLMRVRDFLARIGIDPVQQEVLVRRSGFKGLDERVTSRAGTFKSDALQQNMRNLFHELEGQILEQARSERETLTRYFEEIGLLEENVGIVDVGWEASSARSLQMILVRAGKPRRIPAFYFGTWKGALSAAEAGCQMESLFVNFGQPIYRVSMLMESVELIETFFSAPHPTIIGIDKKNGKWEPVYGEPEVDATTTGALETAARTAIEFIRDALELWPAGQEIAPPFGYLETVLERLLRFPNPEEAAAFGKISWRNTFGGSGPLRQLANPPSSWERMARGNALQEAYDQCYWKKGFLAQLSPRARKYVKV